MIFFYFISFPGGTLFVGFTGTVYVSFACGSSGTREGADAVQARKGNMYTCQSSDRRCHFCMWCFDPEYTPVFSLRLADS